MKHYFATISAAIALIAACAVSCNRQDDYSWIRNSIDTASSQILATALANEESGLTPIATKSHYSLKDYDWQMGNPVAESYDPADINTGGKMFMRKPHDWRSGFFSGSLWYLYELTGKEEFKTEAASYTNKLNDIRNINNTHDLGFMSMCSYGNALRLAPADTIKPFLIEVADNLCTRFDDTIGCIRSWNSDKWNFVVIIDNMMNLNLLFKASELTGDSKYKDIAVRHACTTIANHFRDDCSTFHVVSYNADGSIETKRTAQGRSDDSSWARGQAWGLYGYTETYVNSGDKAFLDQAIKIAAYMMSNIKTEDLIPLWDYDAPDDPRTPRDASAAAIMASGLLQLSTLVEDGSAYFEYAETILKNLASPAYLAAPGTNEGFVLMHSVSSLPGRSEVDSPLNYADYYFLEGLKRYMDIKGLNYSKL